MAQNGSFQLQTHSVDVVGVVQPIILRNPTPSMIKYVDESGAPIFLGCILQSSDEAGIQHNSSWRVHETSSYSGLDSRRCAMFDPEKLIMQSKLGSRQLRIDVFPPYLDTFRVELMADQLSKYYEDFQYCDSEFGFPFLWETNTAKILINPIPILHISLFPLTKSNLTTKKKGLMMPWTSYNEYTQVYSSANVQFFIADLVNNGEDVYQPVGIRYVNVFQESELINTSFEELVTDGILNHLVHHWTGQMHWEILTEVEQLNRNFEKCDDLTNHLGIGLSSAEDFLHQAIVHVWLSIFKNYSYSSDDIICSNGKRADINGTKSALKITFANIYLGQYLHGPMQVSNPMNGSYRFVVCGLKGSEGIQFGELVNVYDKFTWAIFGACVYLSSLTWKLLLVSNFCTARKTSEVKLESCAFFWKWLSIIKFLLEQGDISPGTSSISSSKVRVFLGILLTMCIILSNGYKNANVYNMISPRKPLRYEKFAALVDNNFSIYTLPKLQTFKWIGMIETNWFSQNLSFRKLSEHEYSITYHLNAVEYEVMTLETVLGDIVACSTYEQTTPYLPTKKEIQFNNIVHSSSQAYPADILEKWFQSFKRIHTNWRNSTEELRFTYYLLLEFFEFEFGNIEREVLFDLTNNCNKTALVLPSVEAEFYTRLLTLERGNSGKEVYFQQHLVIRIEGLVTPPS